MKKLMKIFISLFSLLVSISCSPTVRVEPSDKPITINLNVKIEHEVKVKIDKQLENEVFSKDSELF
jgi:hypothetical protein